MPPTSRPTAAKSISSRVTSSSSSSGPIYVVAPTSTSSPYIKHLGAGCNPRWRPGMARSSLAAGHGEGRAMRLWGRVAMLALALAPVAALGDSRPQVILASPGVGGGAIERFTVRFSQPMVPLGDPRAAAPFDVDLPGRRRRALGRSADLRLRIRQARSPAASPATSKLRDELQAALARLCRGRPAPASPSIPAGRSRARCCPAAMAARSRRTRSSSSPPTCAPTRASVAANAYCAVDGLGEKIAGRRAAGRRAGQAARRRSAPTAGTVQQLPRGSRAAAGASRAAPPTAPRRSPASSRSNAAVRCRRGATWRWSGARTSPAPAGKPAGSDQRFDFTVRKPFAARFECSRVNPQAGCNPVEDALCALHRADPARAGRGDPASRSPTASTIAPMFGDDDKKQGDDQRRRRSRRRCRPRPTAKLTLPAGRHGRERPHARQCRALPARRPVRRGAAAGEVRRASSASSKRRRAACCRSPCATSSRRCRASSLRRRRAERCSVDGRRRRGRRWLRTRRRGRRQRRRRGQARRRERARSTTPAPSRS